MREIKFRAWHKKKKTLEEVLRLEIVLKQVMLKSTGYRSGYFNESVILMQYTGLKDKNSIEIYQDDIINHFKHGVLKVEWDYRNTGWICLDKNYKRYKLINILLEDGIKVGNIYENSELLEEINR